MVSDESAMWGRSLCAVVAHPGANFDYAVAEDDAITAMPSKR